MMVVMLGGCSCVGRVVHHFEISRSMVRPGLSVEAIVLTSSCSLYNLLTIDP